MRVVLELCRARVLMSHACITCRFRSASARSSWSRVVFIAVIAVVAGVPLSALGGKQIQFLEADVSSLSVQPQRSPWRFSWSKRKCQKKLTYAGTCQNVLSISCRSVFTYQHGTEFLEWILKEQQINVSLPDVQQKSPGLRIPGWALRYLRSWCRDLISSPFGDR